MLSRGARGSDIVRQMNVLTAIALTGNPFNTEPGAADPELLGRIRSLLDTAVLLTSFLWTGFPPNIGRSFVCEDLIPPPHARSYFGAREKTPVQATDLPQSLARVFHGIKQCLAETDVWLAAIERAKGLTAQELKLIQEERAKFDSSMSPNGNEAIGDWEKRLIETVDAASTPTEFLALQRLIHSIMAMSISLTIWDTTLAVEEIASVKRVDLDEWGLGYEFEMVHIGDLLFGSIERAFRITGGAPGVYAVHGARAKGSGQFMTEAQLTAVRLADLEREE